MNELSHGHSAPRRHRARIRRAGIAAVAALAGTLGTLAPAAAAQDVTWQKTAIAMSKEQCPQGAWRAFDKFDNQGGCVSTMVRMPSPADSDRNVTGEPPPECGDTFGLRPNYCP